jgi:hypothetical protein
MIKLSVEEAYAFDYLAILGIKLRKFPDNEIIINNYYSCLRNIEEELGVDKTYDIIGSPEYEELVKINQLTFNAVDKARLGESNISAKEVDNLNMERYKFKKDLQKKFFDKELAEFKN